MSRAWGNAWGNSWGNCWGVLALTGGKGDNAPSKRRGHLPAKPLGIIDRPRKPLKEGRKDVSDRVDESRQIEADIAAKLARDFSEETLRIPPEQPPVAEMALADIEAEIGAILRKKVRTEQDETMLLLLMAAGVA